MYLFFLICTYSQVYIYPDSVILFSWITLLECVSLPRAVQKMLFNKSDPQISSEIVEHKTCNKRERHFNEFYTATDKLRYYVF